MKGSTTLHASVVIPAHNEERAIEICLNALRDTTGNLQLEVIVVANGCTDQTVHVAEEFRDLAGLRVLSIPEPSKTRALNLGDSVCSYYPRIYLDADVRMGPETLSALVQALHAPGALMASPRGVIDTSRSSPLVRAFYDVFARLPYTQDTTSTGVYGFSEAGRRRFGAFPEVTADDLFVQRLFSSDERLLVDAENLVMAPRDLHNLIRVRRRAARGNKELSRRAGSLRVTSPQAFRSSTGSTVRALLAMACSSPRMWPDIAVYAGVTIIARVLSGRPPGHWERDASTR